MVSEMKERRLEREEKDEGNGDKINKRRRLEMDREKGKKEDERG